MEERGGDKVARWVRVMQTAREKKLGGEMENLSIFNNPTNLAFYEVQPLVSFLLITT